MPSEESVPFGNVAKALETGFICTGNPGSNSSSQGRTSNVENALYMKKKKFFLSLFKSILTINKLETA